MKTWLSSLIFLSAMTLNAQELKDYEYIIIPESFTDFTKNEYSLKSHLNQYLKDKNYKPISFNKNNWPIEIQNNPCIALKADIKKAKSFLNNKLEINFTDCQQQVIYSTEGTSRIKEFQEGYQEALKLAANYIPASMPNNPVFIAPEPRIPEDKPTLGKKQETIITAIETPVNNTVTEIKEEIVQNTPVQINTAFVNTAAKLEENKNQFSNGKITVDKIDLKDGGFMLMNPDNAQIIAKFYPSLKANIYHVILTENNLSTIGYTDKKVISYEIPSVNNTWTEVKFTSK